MTRPARLLLLPLALAASPAFAQDIAPRPLSLNLTGNGARLLPPEPGQRGLPSLALPQVEMPAEDPWYRVLPLVGGASSKGREKGFSFGLKPGKKPKAVARFRF